MKELISSLRLGPFAPVRGLFFTICGSPLFELADDQHRVVAAEAKGVVEADADAALLGGVGHVVQVARRVGRLIVDGRRRDLVADGQGAEDALDRPRRCLLYTSPSPRD